MTECYQNVVGLSREQCQCQPLASESYNTSLSGLYIADLAPLKEAGGYNDCAPGGIWDTLNICRENAISELVRDINALALTKYRPKRKAFSGGIGMLENKGTKFGASPYQGIRVGSPAIKGGYMKVRGIGLHFGGVGTFDITILNKRGEEIETVEVTCANGLATATLDTPITLPLSTEYGDYAEYFFVYSQADAPAYRENRTTCGCMGGPPVFNLKAPYWNKSHGASWGWADWVMAGGWEGSLSDINYLSTSALNNQFGLSLVVDLYCTCTEVLCKDTLNMNSELAMTQAFAILYKAQELALETILTSQQLTRGKITNNDQLKQERDRLSRKYTEMVDFIISNLPYTENDCLDCKPAIRSTTRSIL